MVIKCSKDNKKACLNYWTTVLKSTFWRCARDFKIPLVSYSDVPTRNLKMYNILIPKYMSRLGILI